MSVFQFNKLYPISNIQKSVLSINHRNANTDQMLRTDQSPLNINELCKILMECKECQDK